jgi:predicted aspartyl protease
MSVMMSSQNSKHHFCEAAREKRKKNIVTSDNTRMERAERGTMRDEASSENIQDQKISTTASSQGTFWISASTNGVLDE